MKTKDLQIYSLSNLTVTHTTSKCVTGSELAYVFMSNKEDEEYCTECVKRRLGKKSFQREIMKEPKTHELLQMVHSYVIRPMSIEFALFSKISRYSYDDDSISVHACFIQRNS